MSDGSDYGLKTIENGRVPGTRMGSARTAQDLLQRLIDADSKRSWKRTKVDGLVDGNPPYNHAILKDAGRRDACNVNWGTGRSYLEASVGAFYDLASEAPSVVSVETSHGNDENRVEWSRIMSEAVDRMIAADKAWDAQVQLSQSEMVLHGTGPLFFEDAHKLFPRAIETGNFMISDRAPSDPMRWEVAFPMFEYYPPELYEFIQNEQAAMEIGWDVEHTRLVIEHAIDQKQPDKRTTSWEWFQTELKTNSFEYVDNARVCKLAHCFWKEFDGRISHGIIEREDSSGVGTKYLFIHIGRYDNFYQVIHPMYFDRGRGGYHHTVTGLGVKMLSAMEYQNRLMCNLMDKTFAPKALFKPTTPEAAQKFQLTRFGDYALMSPGVDFVQAPMAGVLTDGLAMFNTSSELMRSNLSQYRQQVQMEKPGNPETAFKERMNAAQQGSLSNTTFSRYYKQLDFLYAEIVRRAYNLNTTDARAMAVQEYCIDRGVPRECFGRIEKVVATRVVGQGSPFMRQEVLSRMGSVIGRCSEDGQNNWLNDFISANAGQSAVSRYNPKNRMSQLSNDQKVLAMLQVSAMKIGVPPQLSPSQNPLTFAGLFIKSSVEAINSVKQGGNPMEVLAFLNLAMPAAMKHIKRMENDPLRKEIVKPLMEQWKRIAGITDKIKKQVQQQQQKAKAQQGKTQQVMSDIQLKQLETQSKIKDRQIKTRAQLQDKMLKTRQQLALNDARTASDVNLAHFRALNE